MKLIRFEYPAPTDFDQFLGAFFPSTTRFAGVRNPFFNGAATGVPAADVYEDANNYHVKLELPGVRKQDISVELENDTLTVAASRADQNSDGETRAEYHRSLALPEGLDAAKVTAIYADGVLTVTLPKPESRKPRSISVN